MSRPAMLEVRGLVVRGPRGEKVLGGVDLTLRAGEVTALVGETGCGKTTLLNSVLGLLPAGLHVSHGEVRLSVDGADLVRLTEAERRRYLGLEIGYVPQDVRSGLNPLMTARDCVLEAARRRPEPVKGRVEAALLRSGLSEEFVRHDAGRRPGRLSGGQCQRVLIAQAIVNEPRVLLLDEPTASLDAAAWREVQATVRALAGDQRAICLVTHDVAALPGLADRVGVMYLGRVVEVGPADEVLRRPQHPYTQGLLACVPRLERRAPLVPIAGDPPAGPALPGCAFHPRCPLCEERCRSEEPLLRETGSERKVACHVSPARP